ncbi:alpha/beta fold hydrolase [Lachnoanaerobaculum sp. OBRC5-5]|uniref:alpha/beta fold hydrolase n=1 Tax=Lachnoanaerobaculum sp. OBRC5-5 TaxID=936595 RepID=UPI000282544C|nr:alpha/beta hydrolase [Lachnoanaerobaculum sp. OBRC5-5]EJZ71179.1 hypothetical protein HMPREF1135_00415 [Lachnoanaerobaculum sp. OBRC5-5]
MEFYRSNGERIHYEIIGKGFPIVFLHGNNLESSYFKKQMVLGRYYKLIFVDSLGHGKSGDILGKISFSYLADSLDELLSYLNIEKCLLVGHSDGANLAIKYAALHQERVAGILANSGNISFKGLKFLPGYACYLEEVLYKTLGIIFPCFKRRSKVSPLLREDLNIPQKTFSKSNYPVIVLVGDHDMIKREHSISIAELFPRGKFIKRKNQGHNIPKKDSNYFNRTVSKMVSYIQSCTQ